MTGEFVITDGSVEYKHSKPLGEYDNKTPMVRLTFTVAENADPLVVTEKVMGIAMSVVERAIATKVTVEQAAAAIAAEPAPKRNPGRPSKPKPEEKPVEDAADITDEEPEEIGEDEKAAETALTMKDDIQPLAQKVSAFLRKRDGNINKLKDVIKDCKGASLLAIPEAEWPKFIEDAKAIMGEGRC